MLTLYEMFNIIGYTYM